MSYLEQIIQLRTLEILQNDVDRVFSLIDSLEVHNVTVIHSSHQFHLIFQRLSPLVSRVLLFFRKSFNSYHFFISKPFC